ncbi:hypothetical protein [Paenirhodobacter sp. CAU 1674]|uniref:hypothetical protein n=1 Tax=Paenirhodobacter sp. CAU 1674 TaxID=3032596 RepID=UPI0023DB0436|nr:hypothetical protein [Paenirhodobacter sp. CAU 1674]MDF2141482.1 hypothetical protein [Paenirhodobacter sp. CAU 1674]
MSFAPRAWMAALIAAPLCACVAPAPQGGQPGAPALAPAVPADPRSHGVFEQITGINGDAVAAISGDARRSYIYFDAVAAKKAAVEAAPAKLCAGYGRALKSSYVTYPADHVPGVKALVVDCAS